MRQAERRRRRKAHRRRELASQVQAARLERKQWDWTMTPHRLTPKERMQAFRRYAKGAGTPNAFYLCITDNPRPAMEGPPPRETWREKKSYRPDSGELELARRLAPYG